MIFMKIWAGEQKIIQSTKNKKDKGLIIVFPLSLFQSTTNDSVESMEWTTKTKPEAKGTKYGVVFAFKYLDSRTNISRLIDGVTKEYHFVRKKISNWKNQAGVFGEEYEVLERWENDSNQLFKNGVPICVWPTKLRYVSTFI